MPACVIIRLELCDAAQISSARNLIFIMHFDLSSGYCVNFAACPFSVGMCVYVCVCVLILLCAMWEGRHFWTMSNMESVLPLWVLEAEL